MTGKARVFGALLEGGLVFMLLLVLAHNSLIPNIFPARASHALRCVSDSVFGTDRNTESLGNCLAYTHRDAETRRPLIFFRERIENYFARVAAYTRSLANHPRARAFFQRSDDMGARTRIENFLQRAGSLYEDIDEIIIGRASEVYARSEKRALPLPGEAIETFLDFSGGNNRVTMFLLPGPRFLLLVPMKEQEYLAVVLNTNMLSAFLNDYPQEVSGVYLACGDDKSNWLSANGDEGIIKRLRAGDALLEDYAKDGCIEFVEERFRNISLPVRSPGSTIDMVLGVLEEPIHGGWYIPLVLDCLLSFVFVYLVYWIIRRFCCEIFLLWRSKKRTDQLLMRALGESQENFEKLIASSRKLARQTREMQTHVKSVSLPVLNTPLHSGLMLSAEPDLAHLRRIISGASKPKIQSYARQ